MKTHRLKRSIKMRGPSDKKDTNNFPCLNDNVAFIAIAG